MARFPDVDALLAAYTTDQPAGWALLERCANHLPVGRVVEALVVDGDTWHQADGTSGPADRYGPLAAEASFHGLERLPTRNELVASFASAPDTDELTTHVAAALDALPPASDTTAVIGRMGDLIRHHLPATDPHATMTLDVRDAVELSVLAQHGDARQVALLSLTRNDARRHLAMWRTVVNTVPEYGAEAPLFLAGMAAWVAGEGAAASIALERIGQTGRPGGYPPARILDALIDQVVPPSAWETLRADGLKDAQPAISDAVQKIHSPAVWETVTRHPLPQHRPPGVTPPAPGIAI